MKRGHDVTVLHRRPDHDLGREVHNIQADRGDCPRSRARYRRPLRRGLRLRLRLAEGHTARSCRGRGPRLRRRAASLHLHVEHRGLWTRAGSPRERSARARRLPGTLLAAQGHRRANPLPDARGIRTAADDVQAAVRARAAAAVLSRAVLLGSAASRTADHFARRWQGADAMGVRLGSRRGLRARDGTARRRGTGVQLRARTRRSHSAASSKRSRARQESNRASSPSRVRRSRRPGVN